MGGHRVNCRIMKKDEFTIRPIADQELRRQKRKDEEIRGYLAAIDVTFDGITRSLRNKQNDRKRGRRV